MLDNKNQWDNYWAKEGYDHPIPYIVSEMRRDGLFTFSYSEFGFKLVFSPIVINQWDWDDFGVLDITGNVMYNHDLESLIKDIPEMKIRIFTRGGTKGVPSIYGTVHRAVRGYSPDYSAPADDTMELTQKTLEATP